MMTTSTHLVRRRSSLLALFFTLAFSLSGAPAGAQTCASSIGSNFNGTSIPGGRHVWFNAIVKVAGRDVQENTTLSFDSSQISFASGGTNYSLDAPASRIEFSPTVAQATTRFDDVNGTWVTQLPASYTGNVFLSGLAFAVPASGLPGGTNPVTWSGRFTSSTPGLRVSWKWAAAVYTTFSSLPEELLVKPVDNKIGVYQNSDHAGTPQAFKSYVVGGARGGGGSNYTGSYSGTGSSTPCVASRQLVLAKAFEPYSEGVQWLGYPGEFTLTVTNNGPLAAGAIVVTDPLDRLMLSPTAIVTNGNGVCSITGAAAPFLLTCTLNSLTVEESAMIRVRYETVFAQAEGTFVNCATARDSDGNTAQVCASIRFIPGPD
jgi:Domain of unknown function DUF11